MNSQNKKQNITVHYSCVQASYWMGFACVSAFSSVYLLSLGISNSLIGLTLALGSLASALIQPYVGILIDNNPKISTKKILLSAAITVVVIALLLFPVSKGVPVIIPVMYGTLMLLLQLSSPFTNSLGMAGINAGYRLDFGPARAIGSLGYASVSLVLGRITASVGGHIVPVFIISSFVLMIVALFLFPLKEGANNVTINKDALGDAHKPSVSDFFKKYKALGIMIVGLIFIYFSHVVLNSFGLQIITSKGGTSENMGISTAISATIEVVPMFLFPLIKKKVKVYNLLKLSAVFFTLKILASYIAPNVQSYYAVQFCQMLGWGVMAVSIVYYVNDLVDVSDTAQGQAYAGMTLTIGNVMANLIGGRVIDSFGINTLLIIGFIAALIGTTIFWTGINLSKVKKDK